MSIAARCKRFLQTEPVGYADDLNLYAYVGNDPLDKTDPSGNCFEDACVGEAIAACAASPPCAAAAVATAVYVTKTVVDVGKTIHDHIVNNEAVPSDAPKTDKPSAPPGNGGTTETPHGSPEHDAKVNEEVQKMRDKNYGDIRKNQTQVDAQGNKVGNNRPDVQGTNPETGQREHVDVDRDPNRGVQHDQDIRRNDRAAKCTLLPCP